MRSGPAYRPLLTRRALAGSLAVRGGVRPKPPPRRAPPPAAPKPVAATPRPGTAAADTVAVPAGSSGGDTGGGGGGGSKRKVKHEGAKAKKRKKRLERERAAAAEAAEQQPRDRPRFGEVADAPPAVALQRKHGLGQLFVKQLASAASGTREREQLRAGAVEHYRKLRGRVALPYLAAMREHAEQRAL